MNVSGLAFIDELPDNIEYTGEFGKELILFIPFVRWLSATGLLKSRSIITYRGMRSFYDGLLYASYREKDDPREHVPHERMPAWMPFTNEHDFDGRHDWPYFIFGDERRRCLAYDLKSSLDLDKKPLIIIHNKVANEWNRGPVNTISLDELDKIFTQLKQSFNLLYIRHRPYDKSTDFAHDHNGSIPIDDDLILASHPEVLEFHALYDSEQKRGSTLDINAFKCALYARCWRFITVQGGGAHQIAAYSGSLMVILHKAGSDIRLAYGHGFYSTLANPSPIRMICHSFLHVLEAITAFDDSTVIDKRLYVDARHAGILRKFSPFR